MMEEITRQFQARAEVQHIDTLLKPHPRNGYLRGKKADIASMVAWSENTDYTFRERPSRIIGSEGITHKLTQISSAIFCSVRGYRLIC
jgi:hypothetical protein